MKSDVLINRLYEVIRAIDPYEARNNDLTREDVKAQLVNDPESIIAFLLDYIEEV